METMADGHCARNSEFGNWNWDQIWIYLELYLTGNISVSTSGECQDWHQGPPQIVTML